MPDLDLQIMIAESSAAGALTAVSVGNTEKLAFKSDTYYALCRRQVYDD